MTALQQKLYEMVSLFKRNGQTFPSRGQTKLIHLTRCLLHGKKQIRRRRWFTPTSGLYGVVTVVVKVHPFLRAAGVFGAVVWREARGRGKIREQQRRGEERRGEETSTLRLTLRPDEDFESEAAPPPPHVGDGG